MGHVHGLASTKADRRKKGSAPTARDAALFCVGLGTLLALWCRGAIGGAVFESFGVAWGETLALQTICTVATAAGLLAARRLAPEAQAGKRSNAGLSSMAAAGMCLALAYAFARLGAGAPAAFVLAAVLGCALAWSMVEWFQRALNVYRAYGRAWCVALISASEVVSLAISAGVSLAHAHGRALLAVALAAVATCAACQELAARSHGPMGDTGHVEGERADGGKPYRISRYAGAILSSVGITWGMAFGVATCPAIGGAHHALAISLVAGFAACLLTMGYFLKPRKGTGSSFGMLVRITLAMSGLVMAGVPVLAGIAPGVVLAACQALLFVQAIVMNVFALEVCREEGRRVVDVWTTNYALFIAASAASTILFWLVQGVADQRTTWEVAAFVSVAAVMAAIPMLPSQRSGAVELTLDSLPENEGFDDRVAQSRERMAAKYGLSPREKEVLDLLARGLTNSEIASELSLSPWTTKDYIKAVYAKTGVHSAKELVVLVAAGEHVGK